MSLSKSGPQETAVDLLALVWMTMPFCVGWSSSCQTPMTSARVPSALDAADCNLACDAVSDLSVSKALCMQWQKDAPLPGSWVTNDTNVSKDRDPHRTWPLLGSVPRGSFCSECSNHTHQGRHISTSKHQSDILVVVMHGWSHTPGVVASSSPPCTCLVEPYHSPQLVCTCSHCGSPGPGDHPSLRDVGQLSESLLSSALPVCHLGLPGSAEMAESETAAWRSRRQSRQGSA